MEWYYAIGSEQKGPVDRGRLLELASIGDVTAETLVWREGMADWVPYRTLAEELGGIAESGPSGKVQRCAYSGELRPESEMLRYGEHWVRADCKDAFVASLQTGKAVGVGAPSMEGVVYVGFWSRVLAKLIDGVLFLIVLAVCAVPAILIGGLSFDNLFDGGGEDFIKVLVVLGLGVLLWFGLNCFYATWMVGKYGATLGKMAIGAKVVGADGSSVSYMRAFARFWAEFGHSFVFGMIGGIVGAMLMIPFAFIADDGGGGGGVMVLQVVSAVLQYGIGYAGYYWVAFHKQKAAVHDLLCQTRVVRK